MAPRSSIEVTSRWELKGPFFEKDVEKTVIENIGDMLDRAAEFMEADVRDAVAGHAGGMPAYTGWSWARTVGRRKSGRTGKTWTYWAVVSANTIGGDPRVGKLDATRAIRTLAAAATIERRWHPYRNATRAARRAIKTLDLTKGLE